MAVNLIFDKSFLESLTLDESVWLDNFFFPNITPIFYVETLADLEKEGKKGKVVRTPEELVGELAKKTPVIHTIPNVHHHRLVLGDLMGHEVEMSEHHRPIISGGEYKISPDGKVGVNFKQFPESEALQRWKQHDFLEIEKGAAKEWREALSNLTFDAFIALAKNTVPMGTKLSTLEDVKSFVDGFVKGKYNQLIHLAFEILGVPDRVRRPILKRWYNTRPMPFDEFAPYAAYVLKVDLFFYLCLGKSLISKDRASNKIDLAYLYYLPFCMAFASNDKLHARIVPLFLGKEQTFIPGTDLKEDLAKLNDYYSKLPDNIKARGIMEFAVYPPEDIDTLVGRLHDKHLAPWRDRAKSAKTNWGHPLKQDKEFLERIKKEKKEQKPYTGPPLSSDQTESMTLSRMVPIQRGSWRILPPEVERSKSE